MSKLKTLIIIGLIIVSAWFIHQLYIKDWNLNRAISENLAVISPSIGGFTQKLAADPTTALMTSGGSIVAVGGLAYKALGSIKSKFSKQVSEITVNSNSQIQKLTDQTTILQTKNEELSSKVEELENLPDPTQALEDEILNLKEQNKTLSTAVEYFTKVQAEAQVLADNKEVVREIIG